MKVSYKMNNNYSFSVPVFDYIGDDDYVIFAPNYDQAEIMLGYFSTEELQHSSWSGRDWQTFETYGSKTQLLRARKQNKTGLGIYVKGEGWKIMSLDEAIHARLTEAL